MSYKVKYPTGGFNRRVTFKSWGYSKDAGGGASASESSSFEKWAIVRDRSARKFETQAQEQWEYDVEIVVRKEQEIKSGMTAHYEGATYKIQSVSVDEEGQKRFYVIRCSKTDERV